MWEIVQPYTYQAIAAVVSNSIPRFDAVYAAVEWALQRNPEVYPKVEERRSLRQIKTRAFGNTPAMRFLYVCHGNKVTMRYVEVMDEPDNGGLRQMLPEGGW